MVAFIVDLYTFSPNGLHLACLNHTEKQILIRRCEVDNHSNHNASGGGVNNENRFKLEHKFEIKPYKNGTSVSSCPVDNLVWSPDSCFIAASCKKYAVISIFSVLDSTWRCRLTLGPEVHGLESYMWGRDARHLICVSGSISFLSVWSIRSNQVQYIKDICPIQKCAGICYSPNGISIAVAQITSTTCSTSKPYYIGIYSTSSKSAWNLCSKFSVVSRDLAGISWCPNSSSEYLCLWDSNLFSNLYVYNTSSGALIKQYSPYGMTSSGFSSVQWTPSGGDFLICTTQNKNELHVLNGLTFGVLVHDVLEPERSSEYLSGEEEGRVLGQYEIFYEANKQPSLGMNKYLRLSKWPSISLDATNLLSVQVHYKSPPNTTHIKLSPDGNLFACITRFYPQVVWIYDLISTASPIAVLIHQHPVADFDWNPTPGTGSQPKHKLAIICQSSEDSRGLLYFWTQSSTSSSSSKRTTAYIHNTTAKFSFSKVEWSPLGDLLLIRDNLQKIHLLPNL